MYLVYCCCCMLLLLCLQVSVLLQCVTLLCQMNYRHMKLQKLLLKLKGNLGLCARKLSYMFYFLFLCVFIFVNSRQEFYHICLHCAIHVAVLFLLKPRVGSCASTYSFEFLPGSICFTYFCGRFL